MIIEFKHWPTIENPVGILTYGDGSVLSYSMPMHAVTEEDLLVTGYPTDAEIWVDVRPTPANTIMATSDDDPEKVKYNAYDETLLVYIEDPPLKTIDDMQEFLKGFKQKVILLLIVIHGPIMSNKCYY